MEMLQLRIKDGDVFPYIGEVFYKRSHIDGVRHEYQIFEEVSRQRGKGVDLDIGVVEWTDITYNMKEVAPAE